MPPVLRHRHTPRAAMRCGASPRHRSPLKHDAPLLGGTTPAMLLSVVDLPAPLRPSSVTVSPSPTVERHALQGYGSCRSSRECPARRESCAASGDHVAEIGAAHALVAADVVGSPSTSTRPCCMTVTRVGDVHHDVHVVLDEHDGVVVAQAADSASCRRDRRCPCPKSARRERSAFGFAASAMPTSSRRCWPCESTCPRRPAQAFEARHAPAPASTVSAAARARAHGRPSSSRACAARRPAPRARRFSRTDRLANRLVTWNERAMPRRARW